MDNTYQKAVCTPKETTTKFSMIPPFVHSASIKWTPRAKISVTPWTVAQSVAKKCKEIFPDAEFIIDTTACYGNETMAFRLEYNSKNVRVEACEWDLTHMVQLRNIIHQSPCKSTILLNSTSSVKRLHELPIDLLKKTIVICDPYWGGSDYKKQSIITTLKLADTDIKDLVVNIPAALWVLKVPANYDKEHLLSEIKARGMNMEACEYTTYRPNGSVGMIHLIFKQLPTGADQ